MGEKGQQQGANQKVLPQFVHIVDFAAVVLSLVTVNPILGSALDYRTRGLFKATHHLGNNINSGAITLEAPHALYSDTNYSGTNELSRASN